MDFLLEIPMAICLFAGRAALPACADSAYYRGLEPGQIALNDGTKIRISEPPFEFGAPELPVSLAQRAP